MYFFSRDYSGGKGAGYTPGGPPSCWFFLGGAQKAIDYAAREFVMP